MIYEFTPTQDLHGYDAPWPAGGGKNKFQNALTSQTINDVVVTVNNDGSMKLKGIASANTTIRMQPENAWVLPAGEYIFSVGGSQRGVNIGIGGGTSEITYSLMGTMSMPVTRTLTAEGSIGNFLVSIDSGTNCDITIQPMIRLASVTDPTFSPYSNTCPISGYNIWDPLQEEMIPVYSGYVDANANKLYLHPVYEEYDGEELVGPWMSSMDKYTEEGTPTEGAFVVDFGGEVTEYDISDFMLQTLLDSLGIRRFITSGATLLNSLMDQAQGRVRSEEELLNLSMPIQVIAIGKELPTNLVIKKPVSDVLPGLPGKTKI